VSYPYPQDRNRERREKGEQPYKDAREAMTEKEATIQAEAEAYGEIHQRRAEEERAEHLEDVATASMRKVGAEREQTSAETGVDGNNSAAKPA
jgi:hypothetical protein